MTRYTSDGQCMAPAAVKISAADFLSRKNTSFYWLGMAGFMLNARGTVLLLDPLLVAKPAKTPGGPNLGETGQELLIEWPIEAADVPRMDAVLYTHTDDDHLGPETAKVLIQKDPLFIGTPYCKSCLAELGVRPARCLAGGKGDVFEVGCTKIEFLPADHSWQLTDPKKYPYIFGTEDCCGYKITTPDGIFLFPGDTRLMKAHLTISGVDVIGLDMSQDSYHLGVQGAAILANHLDPALIVPCHYGTFHQPNSIAQSGDPKDVLEKVEHAAARARILAPGQPLVMFNRKEQQHD